MKEISLLLRPEMARAYALGLKTQTRRLITRLRGIGSITEFGPSATPEHFSSFDWQFRDRHKLWHDVDSERLLEMCPYGGPDDRLRLLTTWAVHRKYDKIKPTELPRGISLWSYFMGTEKLPTCGRLRPGLFLPERFRHFMPAPLITDMRVELVQDISEEDAIAEGIVPRKIAGKDWIDARFGFQVLWDTIHGPGAWERNEYVWRIELQKYSEVSDESIF